MSSPSRSPEAQQVVKKTVANGKIVPRKEILIKPVVSGIIRELYVEAGDDVKKGERSPRSRSCRTCSRLSNAENRVRNAEIDRSRTRKLNLRPQQALASTKA